MGGADTHYRGRVHRPSAPALVTRMLDPGLAALLLGVGLFEIFVRPVDTAAFLGPVWVSVGFLVLCTVPLAWRRRAPVAVLVTIAVAAQAWVWLVFGPRNDGPFEPFVALLVAVYTAAAHTDGRRRLLAAAVPVAVVVFEAVAMLAGRNPENTVPGWVLFGAAWTVGLVVSSRARMADDLRRTAQRLEAEREARTAQAVLEERARIARELHDVITHSVSVMVIQAGVEARNRRTSDPEAAEVLGGIERAGRDALVELRRLLGVLRTGPADDALTPSPTLQEVDALVAQVRRPGLEISLDCDAVNDDIPAGVDLSAYRIVQEALTNVLKHGRDASRVDVRIRRHNGSVELDVTDNGVADGAIAAPGNGIIGMQERVALHGGQVDVGPAPEGGWRVRALLPLQGRPA